MNPFFNNQKSIPNNDILDMIEDGTIGFDLDYDIIDELKDTGKSVSDIILFYNSKKDCVQFNCIEPFSFSQIFNNMCLSTKDKDFDDYYCGMFISFNFYWSNETKTKESLNGDLYGGEFLGNIKESEVYEKFKSYISNNINIANKTNSRIRVSITTMLGSLYSDAIITTEKEYEDFIQAVCEKYGDGLIRLQLQIYSNNVSKFYNLAKLYNIDNESVRISMFDIDDVVDMLTKPFFIDIIRTQFLIHKKSYVNNNGSDVIKQSVGSLMEHAIKYSKITEIKTHNIPSSWFKTKGSNNE